MRCSFLCSLLVTILYMFRESLAHHQELRKLCVQPGVVFNYPWFWLSVCHVLYLCKVLWVLDWCAMAVHWVVCTVSCGVTHYFHSAHYPTDNHRRPIQDPLNLTQIQHVTHRKPESRIIEHDTWLHTVSWAPDDERVTLETCRVLLSIKSTESCISLVTYEGWLISKVSNCIK